MEPIAIVGLGVVSPIGNSVDEFFTAQVDGTCGLSALINPPLDQLRVKVAGQVLNFDPERIIRLCKFSKHSSRFIQFGLEAARQALMDAQLIDEQGQLDQRISRDTIASVGGCGIGGLPEYERQTIEQFARPVLDSRKVSPRMINELIADGAAGATSIVFGLRGPGGNVQAACASGLKALCAAARLINSGEASMAVVVSAESCLTYMCFASFDKMNALSRNSDVAQASCPFDQHRDGFVLSEGAAAAVLMPASVANQLGIPVQATLLSYAETSDACSLTNPSLEGQVSAMTLSLERAHCEPNDIDAAIAHGTSTPLGDRVESQSFVSVFSSARASNRPLPIYSGKGHHGHPCGPAGMWSLVTAVAMLNHNVVPAIYGLTTVAEDCQQAGLHMIAGQPLRPDHLLKRVLINAFGFCGANASIIIGRPHC